MKNARRRKHKVNSKEIKKWKIDNDISNASIVENTGVSYSSVVMTVNGYRKHKAVIDAFVKIGCPREFFDSQVKKAA